MDAYHDTLGGFANVVWDDSIHAFILETSIHPRMLRQDMRCGWVREAARHPDSSRRLSQEPASKSRFLGPQQTPLAPCKYPFKHRIPITVR
jgi:hypothetical protein